MHDFMQIMHRKIVRLNTAVKISRITDIPV